MLHLPSAVDEVGMSREYNHHSRAPGDKKRENGEQGHSGNRLSAQIPGTILIVHIVLIEGATVIPTCCLVTARVKRAVAPTSVSTLVGSLIPRHQSHKRRACDCPRLPDDAGLVFEMCFWTCILGRVYPVSLRRRWSLFENKIGVSDGRILNQIAKARAVVLTCGG